MSANRAIIYGRVSGDDTTKDGRNLSLQIEMGRTFAQEKGYEVVAEIPEDERGASGAEIDLPGLNQIRAKAATKSFDVLIVREVDRLSRNLVKQLIVEDELKRHGIRIDYVIGEYSDTPEGQLHKNIKAVIAEYERVKISERINRAKRNKIEKYNHVIVAGNPPYGYRLVVDDKGIAALVIEKSEARIVRLIYHLYVTEKVAVHKIALKLKKMKIFTHHDVHRHDTPTYSWSGAVVARILKNSVYIGTWYYGKSGQNNGASSGLIKVDVPAIITPALQKEAITRLAYKRKATFGNTKHTYLLQLRLTCQCNRRIFCQTKNYKDTQYQYYRCQNTSCDITALRTDLVDDHVWTFIKRLLSDQDMRDDALKEYEARKADANNDLQDRIAEIKADIVKHHDRLKRVIDLYIEEADPDTLAILKERQKVLQDQLSALTKEKIKLETALVQASPSEKELGDLFVFLAELNVALLSDGESDEAKQAIFDALEISGIIQRKDDGMYIELSSILGIWSIPLHIR